MDNNYGDKSFVRLCAEAFRYQLAKRVRQGSGPLARWVALRDEERRLEHAAEMAAHGYEMALADRPLLALGSQVARWSWRIDRWRIWCKSIMVRLGVFDLLQQIPRPFSRAMSFGSTLCRSAKRPLLLGFGVIVTAGGVALVVGAVMRYHNERVEPVEKARLEVESQLDLVEAEFHEMEEDEVFRTYVRPNSLRYVPRMLRALAAGKFYKDDRRSTRGRGVPYRGELIIDSSIHVWASEYMLAPGAPLDEVGFRADLYHRVLNRARSEGYWFETTGAGVQDVDPGDQIFDPLLRLCAFDAVQLGSTTVTDCATITRDVARSSYRQAWECYYVRTHNRTGLRLEQKAKILLGEYWMAFGGSVQLPPSA